MNTVSVIVPTYCREEALVKMLRTLLTQDFDDFEILLIDQTPEHSEQTTRFLDMNADRIKPISQKYPSLPMARNTGLSLAVGRYIIFFDDDLLLPSNSISMLVDVLDNDDVDGATGLIDLGRAHADVRREFLGANGSNKRSAEGAIYVSHIIGGAMAFRREVFEKIGGFDERLGELSKSAVGEEIELCRRAVRAGFKLAVDTNLMIGHPHRLPGGCGGSEVDADVARSRHIRSNFYMEMKLSGLGGKIGLVGWVRMLRGWVINRVMLKRGAAAVLQGLGELKVNYKIVRKFYLDADR